jgi:predicted nucleic acid-binding protein
MNLLVKYLSCGKYRIISTLIKRNYYNCLKVETEKVILRFVDVMIYAPDCTLDQFTQDYTEKKGVEE